jgi:DNA-directed RNA polymerase
MAPQLSCVVRRYKYDGEPRSITVDFSQMNVEILTPKLDLLKPVVENFNIISNQGIRDRLHVRTIFTRERECNIVFDALQTRCARIRLQAGHDLGKIA